MKKLRLRKPFLGPYSKDMKSWPSINPNIDFDNWSKQKLSSKLNNKDLKQCKKCGTLNYLKLCRFCK